MQYSSIIFTSPFSCSLLCAEGRVLLVYYNQVRTYKLDAQRWINVRATIVLHAIAVVHKLAKKDKAQRNEFHMRDRHRKKGFS